MVRAGAIYSCTGAQLNLTGDGGWRVAKGGTLELKNVIITLAKKPPRTDATGWMVSLDSGANFLMHGSTLRADLDVEIPTAAHHQGSPQGWLIRILTPRKGTVTTIVMEDNRLSASRPESVGLLQAFHGDATNYITRTDLARLHRKDGFTTGRFRNNQIDGFTGVFIAHYLRTFSISHNRFEHNYGQNIMVSGQNITIESNSVLFPGNGGNGDGISVFGHLQHARIARNTIRDGSCYGIWVQASTIRNVTIMDNTISGGVTGGIHFSAPVHLPIVAMDTIQVTKNMLSRNKGFGISVDEGMYGITLIDNALWDNHPKSDKEIGISKKALVTLQNNRLSTFLPADVVAEEAAVLYF